MDKTYHTLYIPLPANQDNKLFLLFKHLNKLYPNTFLNEYSWMAHITLISLELFDYDSRLFVEICQNFLLDIKSFEIHFDGLGLSQSGKFVVLNLSPETSKYLYHIKSQIDDKLSILIKDNVPQKYTRNWDSLSDKQKSLVITTGSKYEYIPHISIIKLHQEDAKKALSAAKKFNIGHIDDFTVQEFRISKETGNYDNPFVNLGTIRL